MKRRTKVFLAATAAITVLGFAFYRLYIPHTTTNAISKFGFAGASALESGQHIKYRRVFAPAVNEARKVGEPGTPTPSSEYSSWVWLRGEERDSVQRALTDEVEGFVNFDTACRFHTDVEIVVQDTSLQPTFTIELCQSCNKWRTGTNQQGRFEKDSVLATLGNGLRPYAPPTLSETFVASAAAAISSGSRIAIRRVFADYERKRPITYSALQMLSGADLQIVRTLLAANFSRADPNPYWTKACLYHPDMQFFIYDPLDQLVARIELCLGCGDWVMFDVGHGGYSGEIDFQRILNENCPPPFVETFSE